MDILFEQLFKLILSIVLGGFIGWERERCHKPAGLRTHMLVCLGSTLITILSVDFFSNDYTRIIAAVMTGIGFLCAGAIIAQGTKGVHGLTTAASLWIVSIVGIGIGVKGYFLSIATTCLITLILFLVKLEHPIKSKA